MAVMSAVLQAAPMFEDSVEEMHSTHKGGDGDSAEAKPLGIDGLPEYPDDTNLRQLNIRQSSQIFYVDISSITSSKKENTVNLVTVAISPHGARTVAYEGLDCGYRRYQPFAFAGSEGPLKPFADQGWRPIIDKSNGRYRRILIDNYLCRGFAYAASREKILSRMKNLKPYKNKNRAKQDKEN